MSRQSDLLNAVRNVVQAFLDLMPGPKELNPTVVLVEEEIPDTSQWFDAFHGLIVGRNEDTNPNG